MKSILLTLTILLSLACSSTPPSENEINSFEMPPKLAQLNTDNRLSGEVIIYDSNGQEVARGNLTIDNSQVSTPSFDLEVGKAYNFLMRFDYTQDNGSVVTLAYVLFAQEISSDSTAVSFTQNSYVYDTASTPADPSFNFINIPDLDSDDDGISAWTEIDEGTDPADAASFRFPFVINSPQEGDTVKDFIKIDAEFIRDGDAQIFLIEDQSGISDENSNAQIIKATWDTTALPEDKDFTLVFKARNRQGKEFTKQIKVFVDNAPNIDSFSFKDFVQIGDEAEFSWQVNNHSTVEVEGVQTGLGKTGKHRFKPNLTQTYTLKATRTNARGQSFTATRDFKIEVNHPPVFDKHKTLPKGQDPSTDDGLLIEWDHSDSNTDNNHTTTLSLFDNADCLGQAIRQEQSTGKNHRFKNLSPRHTYSYNLTIQDNHGLNTTSSCHSFLTSDRGLVGWWRFIEGAGAPQDFSSFDQTTSLKDADGIFPSWVVDDDLGNSLEFNNDNSSMEIAGDASLDLTSDLSLEVWFKQEPNDVGYILAKNNEAETRTYYSLYADGPADEITFHFHLLSRGHESVKWKNQNIDDNAWHHAVISLKDNKVQLYIDGVAQGKQTVDTDRRGAIAESITIGKRKNQGFPFNGRIKELAIYNRALSAREVRSFCNRFEDNRCLPLLPVAVHPIADGLLSANAKGTFPIIEWGNITPSTYTYSIWELPTATSEKADGTLVYENQSTGTTPSFNPNGLLDYRTTYLLEITACSIADSNQCTINSWRFTTTDRSLFAWWRLDGDGQDSSGNKFHGTANNFADLAGATVAGIHGSAIEFDGSDDEIRVADIWVGNQSAWSYEVWYKRLGDNSTDDQSQAILSQYSDPGGYQVMWRDFDNNFLCGISSPTGVHDTGTFKLHPINNSWHQITCVFDGISLATYVDGKLRVRRNINAANGDPSDIIGEPTNELVIGTGSDAPNRRVKGVIDDVSVYSRAITPLEIRKRCLKHHPTPENCESLDTPIQKSPLEELNIPGARTFFSWAPGQTPEGKTVHHYEMCYEFIRDVDSDGDGELDTIDGAGQCPKKCSTDPSFAGNAGVSCTCQDNYCVLDPLEYHDGDDEDNMYKWKVKTCYGPGDGDCSAYTPVWQFHTGKSLEGWWKFDDANDLTKNSGLNNTAVQFFDRDTDNEDGNTPPQSVDGLIGNAIEMDGVDDNLIVADQNVFDFGTSVFTLAIWFKAPGSIPLLTKKENFADRAIGFDFYLASEGHLRGRIANNTYENIHDGSNTNITADEWHFAVMRRHAHEFDFYIDGIHDGRFNLDGTPNISNNEPIQIGSFFTNSQSIFRPGLIDDVAIFSFNLGEILIQYYFCAGHGLAGTTPMPEVCEF